MKRNFNPHSFQYWLRNIKGVCKQLIVPFCIFQAIRTIIFPTTLDVLLLAIFIILALGFHNDWI